MMRMKKYILIVHLFFVYLLALGQGMNEKISEARQKLQAKDYAGAITLYSEVLSANPESVSVLTQRGMAYYGKGDLTLAVQDFTSAVNLNEKNHIAWYHLAEIRLKQKKYQIAKEHYEEALKHDPSAPHYHRGYGIAQYYLKDYEGANQSFGKALESQPDYYWNFVWKGNALLMLGRYDLSFLSYEKALELEPDQWIAFNQLGLLYSKKGEFGNAIRFYDKSLEITGDSSSTWSNLAALYNKQGRYAEAIRTANKAIELDPNNANAYAHKAFASFNEGQVADAEKDVMKAIELDSEYSQSYYTLALIQETNGNLEAAETHLVKALELTPSFDPFYKLPYEKLKDVRKSKFSEDPPLIIISNPVQSKSRGFEVVKAYDYLSNKPQIRIEGRVESSNALADVLLNGQQLTLNEHGFFSVSHELVKGINEVKITANDVKGKASETSFTIKSTAETPAPPADEEMVVNDEYYAVLIAVQDYDDYGVSDLNKPVLDAQKLKASLMKQYNFDERRILVFENPDRAMLFKVFENISRVVDESDNLLVFYAGHGYWDEQVDMGYWLLRDAVPTNRATWVSNEDLMTLIAAVNSRHTLLIADACFSGSIFRTRALSFANSGIKALYETNSRKAMTSGSLQTVPDESVFLYYLTKRLDENSETYITATNLFNTLKDPVVMNTDNTPMFGKLPVKSRSNDGDFIFIKKQ